MRSRFPGDTGVARYKHLALVMLILAEHKRGEPPTAGSLARSVGTHRSQVDLIVKALCERGLISKTAAPGTNDKRVCSPSVNGQNDRLSTKP